jgi:Tol biopolymer transport system component
VLGTNLHDTNAVTPFTPDGSAVVYAGNDRDVAVQDLLVQDLDTGEVRRFEATTGIMLHAVSVSPDGRWLLAVGFVANELVRPVDPRHHIPASKEAADVQREQSV